MMVLMFCETLLSSQVIGEILDTLGLTECRTTRCDQHINQRSRKLLNYDKTLKPKESKGWQTSLAWIIFLVGLITIFPWTKTNKTKLQIESDIRGAEKKIGNRP